MPLAFWHAWLGASSIVLPSQLNGLAKLLDYLPDVLACVGTYFAVLWLSLVIWTARDVHSRTHDPFVQVFFVLLIAVFWVFALPVYFILRPKETLTQVYERQLEEEALLQDIEDKQLCPSCRQRVEDGFLICPNCHTRLRRLCSYCNHNLNLQWDVCPYCAK